MQLRALCSARLLGVVLVVAPFAGAAQMVQVQGVPFAATQVITRKTPAGTSRTEGKIARNSAGSTYVEEVDPESGRPARVLIADVVGKRLITLDLLRHRYLVRPAPELTSRSVPLGWVGDELRWAEEHRNISHCDPAKAVSSTERWLGTRQVSGVLSIGIVREQYPLECAAVHSPDEALRVTESWFSVELGMAVLMMERVPSSGETTEVTLTGILRSEPSASLFTIPSEYLPEGKHPPRETTPVQEGTNGAL